MSNSAGAAASREEEIAFLLMEQVLNVDIKLADAGAGDKKPDGTWVYPDDPKRHGIVEITSPPATSLMSEWARARKEGRSQEEGGSIDLRLNELAEVCDEMLTQDWATDNIDKLLAQPADERHLFLFARGHKEYGDYFYRLTDSYEDGPAERVDDLVLPEGISDVWFRGRSQRRRDDQLGLAVLARCFQLQEGIAILELDRVLETAPDDLDGHRLGLKAARQDRLDTISRSTERLVTRIQAAAATANSRVLFNPIQSPAVVQASTTITASIGEFHERLGVGAFRYDLETRRWAAAAAEVRDRARTKGVSALGAGKRLGTETRQRANSTTEKVASRFTERARRRRGPVQDDGGEP